MKRPGTGLVFLLCVILSLAACNSTLDIQIEGERTMPTRASGTQEATEQVAVVPSPTAEMSPTVPTVSSTATAESTATATATPTERPTATPTEAPRTEPTSPPATRVPAESKILSFRATPAQADPGEAVTLVWEAEGDRATICPTARYVLFTRDDCLTVSVSGSTVFTIPP
jgi:hypothetical protein